MALLVTLQELMLDPDVAALSVPQVVARAGISQGTFYNYFDSLPDAIREVGVLLFGEHVRSLESVNAGVADPAEILVRTTRQTLMLVMNRPDVGRLLFDSGLPVELLVAGFRIHLRDDLERGVAVGVFSIDDVDAAVALFMGALQGASLDAYRGRLTPTAIPDVAILLLRMLGVDRRRALRLVSAPQDFVPWRPLPLSPVTDSE